MNIGGLQKCSLIDYPGEITAVVFARGCNFRCPYCYNSELVLPDRYAPLIPESEIFSFLERRRGKLGAAAITGGEPCMQEDLPSFIERVRKLGFRVKLDTNGSFPGMLSKVIPLVDYIAMDVKSSPGKYAGAAGAGVNMEDIRKSAGLVMSSGKDYEFRTTVFKGGFSADDFRGIGEMVKGARKHYIQNCMPSEKAVCPGVESCSGEELEGFKGVLEGYVEECGAR